MRVLGRNKEIDRIVGVDVSHRVLEYAAKRLRLEQLHPRQRQRYELCHGSLVYRDERFESFDAAALVEVIEHLDEPRLQSLERVVFEFARPGIVVVTTPNAEYNQTFETMTPGAMRHADHRCEWDRARFGEWADHVCARHGWRVTLFDVGPTHDEFGPLTQGALFERDDAAQQTEKEATP